MMKRYVLYLLLSIGTLPTFGQGIVDYYRLPSRGPQYDRLVLRYGGPHIQHRWYAALDGFIRTDKARLDNSFNGLIENDRVTKANWGVVAGWAYRERWAIEAGYARMPIHTQVSVSNASVPLVFRYATNRNAFGLRGKRLLVSTSGPWLRSGFWLSGGLWLMPNKAEPEGRFSLLGYSYRGRREMVDTLRLISRTNTSRQPTVLAELGAEYNIRLSNRIDLGVSARKFWGMSNALTTDVTYAVNQAVGQRAQLQGTGSGMSYGLTLRYTYATKRQVPDVLDLHGNGKQRIR